MEILLSIADGALEVTFFALGLSQQASYNSLILSINM